MKGKKYVEDISRDHGDQSYRRHNEITTFNATVQRGYTDRSAVAGKPALDGVYQFGLAATEGYEVLHAEKESAKLSA